MTNLSRYHPLTRLCRILAAVVAAVWCLGVSPVRGAEPKHVFPGPGGRLVYEPDARGNRIPDFSHCGFAGGGVAIPDAQVRVRVPARPGDATARIQAAL